MCIRDSSNYCINGCVYCPYHLKNTHIARTKLTQDEVRAEVIALQNMGHKRLADVYKRQHLQNGR